MIIEPYRQPPKPPTVALLTPDGDAVSEHGELLDLDDWPAETRLWASYQTVYDLVRAGKGEALCWQGEEIRWRHRRFEDGWTRRPSDANVIKIPFDHLGVEKALKAFCLWRDWLGMYGASPTGTSGSAAWSLLRARLERTLVTGQGERPPLDRTVGGRQELGPHGPGSFTGALQHLDLPSAYASTLAGLRYGGVWLRSNEGVRGRELERYAGKDFPVFVRAQVFVPDSLPVGPLPSRQWRRPPRSYLEAYALGPTYPHGRLQGLWTWEELQAAEEAGCRIVKVLGGYVHRSGWYPFKPWWEAIEAGRRMPGLAGSLAKVTGNALWGRFCMDTRHGGVRSIRSRAGAKLVARPLPSRGQMWPAHDLAETVSGRVRARLFGLMVDRWDDLVSAHTDGAWLQGGSDGDLADLRIRRHGDFSVRGSDHNPRSEDERRLIHAGEMQGISSQRSTEGHLRIDSEGPGSERGAWRLKEQARRLDLIGPQCLRYWRDPPSPYDPQVVYAGVPAEQADAMFEARWAKEIAA